MEHQLTWEEFKKQIEAAGVKDNTPIAYIDITGYYEPLVIYINEDGDLEVL